MRQVTPQAKAHLEHNERHGDELRMLCEEALVEGDVTPMVINELALCSLHLI